MRLSAKSRHATVAEVSNAVAANSARLLTWFHDRVKLVEPAPLGKQRSRDAKDDPYLACALAAGAKIIVPRDDDLLALQKPFGIQIITPRELLMKLAKPF